MNHRFGSKNAKTRMKATIAMKNPNPTIHFSPFHNYLYIFFKQERKYFVGCAKPFSACYIQWTQCYNTLLPYGLMSGIIKYINYINVINVCT